MAGLPQITPQTFLAIWHQLLTIRADENRQLIALVGPAAGRPAVRTFINDLRVKAAFASRFLDDLTQGRREAARQLLREDIVLAPRWWQDAGRLGAPDCGAVWGPAAEAIAAAGH